MFFISSLPRILPWVRDDCQKEGLASEPKVFQFTSFVQSQIFKFQNRIENHLLSNIVFYLLPEILLTFEAVSIMRLFIHRFDFNANIYTISEREQIISHNHLTSNTWYVTNCMCSPPSSSSGESKIMRPCGPHHYKTDYNYCVLCCV